MTIAEFKKKMEEQSKNLEPRVQPKRGAKSNPPSAPQTPSKRRKTN